MFNVGEFIVCPGHGVGKIQQIEEKTMGRELLRFYSIKLISSGIKVMIPITSEATHLRPLMDRNKIDEVWNFLRVRDVELDTSTWNRRYRDYLLKIKTGSVLELADIIRSLYLMSDRKGLSFGEKKMLNYCKELLVEELSLSLNLSHQELYKSIDDCFNGQNIAL